MVRRRTLGEGLTPEEEAFMDSGAVASQSDSSSEGKTAAPVHKRENQPETDKAPPPFQQPSVVFTLQTPVTGTVGLTTRIPAEISMALMAASMQRQIQQRTPFTRQDIVAEALRNWLKTNGFI